MKTAGKIIIILQSVILVMLIVLLTMSFTKKDASDIFYNSYESVVEVKACNVKGCSYGSGVVVSEDGKIVTNRHVVYYNDEPIKDVSIRLSYRKDYYKVEVLKTDDVLDLALLKVNLTNMHVLKLAEDHSYSYGDKVYAVGNGNNKGIGITEGIVSNPKIEVETSKSKREVIECNLIINEGNSGGALLNSEGELIGITTFRMKDSSNNVIYGLAYSVPVYIVRAFVK